MAFSYSSRFVKQTKEYVQDFLLSEENKNTMSKTKRDVSLFHNYLKTAGEYRQIELIPPNELNDFLSMFILSVRKTDGEEYEPATIRSMISSIDRHLKLKYYPTTIMSGDELFQTRNVLIKKQKKA